MKLIQILYGICLLVYIPLGIILGINMLFKVAIPYSLLNWILLWILSLVIIYILDKVR